MFKHKLPAFTTGAGRPSAARTSHHDAGHRTNDSSARDNFPRTRRNMRNGIDAALPPLFTPH